MEDNEIVKALEICSTYKASCKNCPAFVKVDRSNCRKVLIGAKDIINRLQGENEAYKHYYNECLKDLENAHADNERLKKQKDEFAYLYDKHINTAFSQIKAEAYKEFAERLKENSIATFSFKGVVMVEEIDDLVKEMTGEDNESKN